MSADLAAIFGVLEQRYIVTPATPLPPAQPGIAWIWAANGIFKRGKDATLEALICVSPTALVPGLAPLVPSVCWCGRLARLPGSYLLQVLHDAQRAASATQVATPIEKQYFYIERDGVRVVAPQAQEATATRVRYAMPAVGTVLADVHSHHAMPAYFSSTDDRDDTGLSVSAVLGNIFQRPELTVRINVYGHRQVVPAGVVFDALPVELVDTYHRRGKHAIPTH